MNNIITELNDQVKKLDDKVRNTVNDLVIIGKEDAIGLINSLNKTILAVTTNGLKSLSQEDIKKETPRLTKENNKGSVLSRGLRSKVLDFVNHTFTNELTVSGSGTYDQSHPIFSIIHKSEDVVNVEVNDSLDPTFKEGWYSGGKQLLLNIKIGRTGGEYINHKLLIDFTDKNNTLVYFGDCGRNPKKWVNNEFIGSILASYIFTALIDKITYLRNETRNNNV